MGRRLGTPWAPETDSGRLGQWPDWTETRIRHTVAFALSHAPGSAEEADFLAAAGELGAIPGVEAFEVLREVSPKNGYRFGISMEFADQAAYDAYNAHPDHVRFVETRWLPEVSDFLEIDYAARAWMTSGAAVCSSSGVAEEYDRVRSDYPAEIVDAACAIAGLEPGSPVLEIGCGTGKLTEALVERSLHVEAVDPGAGMIEVARRRVDSAADVNFLVGRFEDVELPAGAFAAAFSATAFHWVDPTIGWAKVADVLRPGGTFALLTYTGFSPLDKQIHAVWTDVRPESREWTPRDEKTLFDGIEARLGNVSTAWAWLNQRERH